MTPGKIVLIVGGVCAGKTTLAKALQEEADEHFLHLSLDAVFAMVAERWGGSGTLTADGFSYQANGSLQIIGYGPTGRRILAGMHRAARSFAEAGVNVVIDDMLLDREVLLDWTGALQGLDMLLVRAVAPEKVLMERAASRRGNRARGLALGTIDANAGFAVDLEIDTSAMTPREGAQRILAALNVARPS